MHIIKKKFILPFLVFVVGMVILGAIVYQIQQKEREQNRTAASLNAMTYAERMKTDIMAGIGSTVRNPVYLQNKNEQEYF